MGAISYNGHVSLFLYGILVEELIVLVLNVKSDDLIAILKD